ncbi:MAG: cytidylate kinase-like family protein [Deltaproteobacteria bacterium]|nr:cytidylate kinase-like family protein [Deltaproteobacteria bacterium]
MAVITISRGSFSHGKEIAETVAEKLGYECVAREILLEASQEFNISEIKLLHAIKDAPSILDRFVYGREKYIAYIQAALLKHLRKDNVIYHGFAGHFFVKDIAHVLKVRIIADLEDRVRLVVKREGISVKEAERYVKKLDEQRKKWSKALYGIDTADPSLYDLVIHVDKITVDEAAAIICHTVGLSHFQTTPQSRQAMDDLYLAAEVKATLIGLKPDIEVSAQDGFVTVKTSAPESQEIKLTEELKQIIERISGVKGVAITILPIMPYVRE